MPPEVLGPLGLTAAALFAVAVLWRAHERHDRDIEIDRNYWRDLALNGTNLGQRGIEVIDKALTVRKRPDG